MKSNAPLGKAARHKPVIGLTGGIGSGKSLVAQHFHALDCGVVDADKLARNALDEPGVREKIAQWLGSTVLDSDGRVNRKKLAAIVFDNSQQLDRLEQIIHPIVRQERQWLRQQFDQDPQIVAIVEDCPLLLEKGIDAECDKVVFVHASKQTRQRRLAANRGWTDQQLAHREKYQMGLDLKRQRADHIIDNEAGESDCLGHVRRVLSQILKAHP